MFRLCAPLTQRIYNKQLIRTYSSNKEINNKLTKVHITKINLTCILLRLTSILSQLSVEKAIAINAADTIAVMVAMDKVTAEQGIFLTFG